MSEYKKLKLKLLNEYKLNNEDVHIDQDDYDKIFLVLNDLKELGFDKRINELNRPIIEVKNGKSIIYRKFKQGNQFGICSNEIGLLKRDVNYLDITKEIEHLELKISSRLGRYLFYFNNPKLDIRLSTRFFIYSILIGIISGIISGIIVEIIHI